MPRELLTMTGTYTQFEGTEIVAENCLGTRVRDLVIEGKTHIPHVPTDYIILDYIESTGTQYIDTGFRANTTTTKFVGAFTPTQQVMGALLGSRNEGQSGSHSCNIFVLADGKFRSDWANGSYTGAEINYVVGTKCEIEITRGTLVINGTTKSFDRTGSVDQRGNFLIGTFNNITTPYANGFVGYIHECKLYSNDMLIRDFIPVKRISDNVVGMYDLVTEIFFTNAGTGEFIAGESASSSPSSSVKSVAEEEGNVLSIINKGKNLIGVLTPNKSWDIGTSNLKDNEGAFCSEKIKVKNNTTYVYSVNGVITNIGILAFNAQGKHISNAYTSSITITDGIEYIAVQGRNPDIGVGREMLEEGTTPTTYKPYRDPIITNINLPFPLRSLPNGVCDTIEGNQLIQRVGKVVLDGTQSFTLSNVNQSETTRGYFQLLGKESKGCNNLICNWYIRNGDHGDYEYIMITNSALFISVLNSKLETTNENGLKKYFSENPLPVYYELTTPITHSLEIPSISTIRGTNVITCNNNIKPVISCKLRLSKARITS